MKSDVTNGPRARQWWPQYIQPLWKEIWPPIGLFTVYILLLYDYWEGATRLPFQDTLYIYETFAIAYNQFFQTGELAQWLPYSNYGMPTYLHDITNFPPFYFVTFAFGAAFNITNIWALFDCAMALDVAIFSFGLYLLFRQFASRAAAAVIMAGALWTLVLEWNSYFTLRLVAMMPLALFFLVRWARNGSPLSLSFAVVIALISCLGVAQYFAPYYALFYTCCTIALWVARRPELRVARPLTLAAVAALALAPAAAVIYLYATSIRDLHFVAYGRDPVTGKADLDTFLNYGGLHIFKILEPFVGLPTENKTALFYAGSVTLVLSFCALWRRRTRELGAFAALLAIFILFCWGPYSPVTRLAYYFPGMSYFRHVGLMYAVPKLLLGIIAAIGLDAALARLDETRREVVRVSFFVGIVSIIIAVAYFPLANLFERQVVDGGRPSSIILLSAALGGYVLVALIFAKAKPAAIVPLLLVTTFAQAAVYQHLFRDTLNLPLQAPVELTHVHPMKFVETRDTGEMRKTNLYEDIARHGVVYAQLDSFLQIDECAPAGHFEYVTLAVYQLMQRVFGHNIAYDDLRKMLADGEVKPSVARVLGCGVAKVQWVPANVVATAANGDKALPDCIDRALCLESSEGDQKAIAWIDGGPPALPDLASQGITVDHFSFNDIAMSLTVNSAGWLVYADSFFPGWHAEVDGKSVPVWRANFAFKAVELVPGLHKVRFYFSDPTYNWVLWASGMIGTVVIVMLFVIAFRATAAR